MKNDICEKLRSLGNFLARAGVNAIFLGFYPTLLFLIYLHEFNIFSYDLFSSGQFGMNAFFYLSLAFSLLLTLVVICPIAYAWLAEEERKKENHNRLYVFYFLSVAVVLVGWMVYLFSFALDADMLLFFALPTIVPVVLGIIQFAKPNLTFKMFLSVSGVLIILVFGLTVWKRDYAAYFVSIGLAKFGVGGMIPVELIFEHGETINGKLILLSPEVAFINDGERSHIVDREKAQSIVVGEKKDNEQVAMN